MKMNGSKDMNSQNYHPVLGVSLGVRIFHYRYCMNAFYGCFRNQSKGQPYYALKKFISN